MLAALGLARGDGVFIANVLKCRPPGNRDPQPDEIESCEPHLFRQIELIEPLGEASPIVKFLEKNPLGGQHHVCFEVPEIHAAKEEFEAKGARVLGEPRIGAHGTLVFFVHPKDMGGVLTEIMETPAH